MKTLLLAEVIQRTSISSGQLIVPLSDIALDYANLEQVFLETLSIYQKYKPDFRKEAYYVDLNGIMLSDATRVVSMRPNVSNLTEFIKPIPFKAYHLDLNSGILNTSYAGNYIVEYLARYRLGNLDINYFQTDLTEYETDFKFKLKGNHKKGTLKLEILTTLGTFEVREDMSSYKVVPSSFTFDTGTNILTINSILGNLLKTGSKLKIKTSGTLPSPLVNNQIYYVIKLSPTTIQLANTIDEAFATIPIDISGISTGTISVESVVEAPLVQLLGSFGYGSLNLQNLEINFNLVGSYTGKLKVSFKSLYLGVENLDIQQDNLFLDLFKAKLMQSVGLIKEILKLPDVPFDFTPDAIFNRGKDIEKDTMELLYAQSYWENFRA